MTPSKKQLQNLFAIISPLVLLLFFFLGLYVFYQQFYQISTPAPDRSRGDGLIISNASVESVNLLVMESFPVQVNAAVKGVLPDPCTQIGEIKSWQEENTFNFIVTAFKPHDVVCDQVLNEFEQVISVPVKDLKAGSYTVNINGIEKTFTLDVDNTL